VPRQLAITRGSLHDFFVQRHEVARELVRAQLNDEKAQGRLRLDVDIDQLIERVAPA
jgi:hypothetical protein